MPLGLENLRDLVKELTTSKEGKTFENIFPQIWETISLEGNPDKKQFEAFMICIIYDFFENARSNTPENQRAKDLDICLLIFGLLNGYYHTVVNNNDINIPNKKRYVEYLKSSDYVRLSYPSPTEKDNLNIYDKNSKPRRALEGAQKRYAAYIAIYIKKHAKDKEYFKKIQQAGVKKYIDESTQEVIYPEPCYTLKNFPLDEVDIISNGKQNSDESSYDIEANMDQNNQLATLDIDLSTSEALKNLNFRINKNEDTEIDRVNDKFVEDARRDKDPLITQHIEEPATRKTQPLDRSIKNYLNAKTICYMARAFLYLVISVVIIYVVFILKPTINDPLNQKNTETHQRQSDENNDEEPTKKSVFGYLEVDEYLI